MVTVMFDEFDPEIAKAFAQLERPLAGDEFMAQVLRSIERAQKARTRRWIAAAAVGAIVAVTVAALKLPATLAAADAAVRFTGDFSPADMALLISPAGWAVSMLVGGAVLYLLRPSRR
jgi:hypothetical protein